MRLARVERAAYALNTTISPLYQKRESLKAFVDGAPGASRTRCTRIRNLTYPFLKILSYRNYSIAVGVVLLKSGHKSLFF